MDAKPVAYMARTREYYQALGYGAPYIWAQNNEVPFTPLKKPLAKSMLALVTTAALYNPQAGDQGPGAAYNGAAKFYQTYGEPIKGDPKTYISHIAYDRAHTSAEDQRTWFPLDQLKRLTGAGRIGGLTKNFYGLPTNRSHKTTLEQDCPALLEHLRTNQADVAVLVANCPVCHQSISLAARHLEQNGMPTIVMGCARDIVEHVGVPRFLFSDFPLGNAAGRPNDVPSQASNMELALDLLEGTNAPRTFKQSPLSWSDTPDWKLDYCNIERLSAEEIAGLRKDFDTQKKIAKANRN